MCRNIKTLFNFDPPLTDEEVHAAALQFVRKISGFNKPSKVNQAAFLAAVEAIAAVSANLLDTLETNAPPKNRAEEMAKARARATQRFSGGMSFLPLSQRSMKSQSQIHKEQKHEHYL